MTRDLSGLDEAGLRDFLDSFDTIICDCDGVLWRGSVPIAGASDFLNDLKGNLTKNVMYITNNSVKTRQENLDKLLHLGFPAQLVRHGERFLAPRGGFAYLIQDRLTPFFSGSRLSRRLSLRSLPQGE